MGRPTLSDEEVREDVQHIWDSVERNFWPVEPDDTLAATFNEVAHECLENRKRLATVREELEAERKKFSEWQREGTANALREVDRLETELAEALKERDEAAAKVETYARIIEEAEHRAKEAGARAEEAEAKLANVSKMARELATDAVLKIPGIEAVLVDSRDALIEARGALESIACHAAEGSEVIGAVETRKRIVAEASKALASISRALGDEKEVGRG